MRNMSLLGVGEIGPRYIITHSRTPTPPPRLRIHNIRRIDQPISPSLRSIHRLRLRWSWSRILLRSIEMFPVSPQISHLEASSKISMKIVGTKNDASAGLPNPLPRRLSFLSMILRQTAIPPPQTASAILPTKKNK